MADSCPCMAKPIQYCKVKIKTLIKKKRKRKRQDKKKKKKLTQKKQVWKCPIKSPKEYLLAVRTGHRTTNWFQTGKGVHQGYILSPCLFNLYAEYIMRNAGLEKAQAGIKIARRIVNNLRYADGTTIWQKAKKN